MELFKLLGRIAIDNDEANKRIKQTTGQASDASVSMTGAFKKIGAAVVSYLAVDKIKDFGISCIQAAADANAASSQFSQVFGDLEGKASKSLSKIAGDAGVTETRMKGSFTKIAAFAKTTGMDTEDALGLSERAMIAVADSAAFYDRSLEETTESLQSFLKGNYENDAALGLSATETTRNAAANALYGKSFNELSESQKQLTLLKMVEDANKTSGALGQAARESETWTNVTGNLKQTWTDFQAVLGQPILYYAAGAVSWVAEKVAELTTKFSEGQNPVQVFIDKIQAFWERCKDAKDVVLELVQGFKDAVEWGKQHETAITLLAIAIGTLTAAVAAYNIAAAIKKAGGIAEIAQLGILQVQIWALSAAQTAQTAVTTLATAATSAFGAVMAFVTSPITLVVVAIGALIAIGVLLYKNWDTIKAKCSELWSNVKEKFSNLKDSVVNKVTEMKTNVLNKFNDIKNGIQEKIENAKEKVKGAIDKIKGFFDFDWSLPKLKLPHFSIKGEFSLSPPSVPSFGIDWYKKAMDNPIVMNEPTIFGYDAATGRLKAGGEAGTEVVSGANTLMNMIQTAVSGNNASMIEVLYRILEAILQMDENMGGHMREALAGTSFEINNREFARLVKAVN